LDGEAGAEIVLSTRSAPASHRFVQVGSFGLPSNAKRTAAQLLKAGLPVQINKTTRGGKELRIVLAGPFAGQADLAAALNSARALGFSDAFLRK